jgi:NAD-dependent DNA ligase
MIKNVRGIATKSAKHFVDQLPRFVKWMHDAKLEKRMEFKKLAPQGDTSHPLFGKNIVTPGVGTKEKQEIVKLLKKVGANLETSVKKDTFAVLVTNPDEDTEKAQKAQKLGIPLILVNDFLEVYNL